MSIPKSLLRMGLRAARGLLDSERLGLGTKRSIAEQVLGLARAPESAIYDFDTLGGMSVQYVTVEENVGRVDRGTILYLHGGGNVLGSARAYRPFAAHLARASGMDVLVPQIPLAPESPYPTAVDELFALYRELPAHGVKPESLVIAGDGSGAGLALALAMRVRDAKLVQPAALGLLSPWLDMVADIGRGRAAESDPWLTPSLLTRWSRTYLAKHEPTDIGVSPLHGEVTDLPAMVVHYADQDPLRSDAEALLDRLPHIDGGPRVIAREFSGLWHAFHLLVGRLPEADEAVAAFADSLNDLTRNADTRDTWAEVVPINRPVADRRSRAVRPAPESKNPPARA